MKKHTSSPNNRRQRAVTPPTGHRAVPWAGQRNLAQQAEGWRGRPADLVAALMAALTIEFAFGMPGGTIAALNDALMAVGKVRLVTVRHESNAVYMAAGYARTSGLPGLVITTSGPGALNTVNGLASARCDNIPVLLLAGEVPRRLHGKHALQDGERLGMLQGIRPTNPG